MLQLCDHKESNLMFLAVWKGLLSLVPVVRKAQKHVDHKKQTYSFLVVTFVFKLFYRQFQKRKTTFFDFAPSVKEKGNLFINKPLYTWPQWMGQVVSLESQVTQLYSLLFLSQFPLTLSKGIWIRQQHLLSHQKMSVLGMTITASGKCGIPLYCYYS